MADLLDFTVTAKIADSLIVMAAKGLVILLLATLVCLVLRNAAASLKHLCWGLALAAVLLLPLLSAITPSWNVGLLDADTSLMPARVAPSVTSMQPRAAISVGSAEAELQAAAAPRGSDEGISETIARGRSSAPTRTAVAAARTGVGASGDAAPSAALGSAVAPQSEAATVATATAQSVAPASARRAGALVLGVWGLGSVLLLLHMLAGSLWIRRIVASARPVGDRAWLDGFEEVSDRLSLRRPVRLLESPHLAVPVAWGAIRPAILIPRDAQAWSDERRRCVLAHELAHIKRWDTLTQTGARLACALHWFNPLAWKAARAMQLEREKACDDYVLNVSRARASEYAGHLLDIARRAPGSWAPPIGVLAMARRSQLEGRVLSILDGGRRRSPAPTPMAASVAVALLIVLPIAAMSPFGAPPSNTARSEYPAAPIDAAESLIAEPVWPGTITTDGEQPRVRASAPTAATQTAPTHEQAPPPADAKEPVQSKVAADASSMRDTIERTFSVADGGLLVIDADHGNVRLNSGASGEVRVIVRRTPRADADAEDYEVEFDQEGDRIRVVGTNTVRHSGRAGVNVDFEVTVPRRFNIDAETAGGNIAIDNLDGRVKLSTSGGNLSLGSISGEVDAHTSGGNISLDGAGGSVVVNTSGGNISLGRVSGTVRATTSGGNISVDEVGGEITARTSGGQISARLTGQPKADCLLRTSGGGITVHLADDIAVDLEAETSAGRVSTDIDVAVSGPIKKNRLHGAINGGGPLLKLETSAGDVRIVRL